MALLLLSMATCYFLLSIVHGGYGPETVINFSGYYPVHKEKRHLFYWFFESRTDPSNDPLIVWLTGGPGCSSMLALLGENGPYVLKNNSDTDLEINPFSWNNNSNIMWIDNPSGAGYSYDDDPIRHGVYTENEIASDLYEFMQQFLSDHPKYASLPFYVTGYAIYYFISMPHTDHDFIQNRESYAGHYVPHFSRHIFDRNKDLKPNNIHINLAGFAIGDGLVSPYEQYQEYARYSLDYGLIGKVEYELMMQCLPNCLDAINNCTQSSIDGIQECIVATDICELCEVEPVVFTGINPYDIREQCTYKPLCYNFTDIDNFFNLNSTIEGLGAKETEWKECGRGVEYELTFAGDWMLDYAVDIPEMIENGISALIYHGEYDFICNWYGGYKWVKDLKWSGNEEWNKAENKTWYVEDKIAGYSQSYETMTFLKVLNAGHMVPRDQPQNALAMIQQFTVGDGW